MVIEMPPTKVKRILNPVTGTYYEIRQRSSVNAAAGEIRGLWHTKKGGRHEPRFE